MVQDDLNLLALVHLVDLLAAADEADHAGVGSKLLKAGEDGGVIVHPVAVEGKVSVAVLLGLIIGLGAAALLAHGVVKAIHVDLKAGLLGHLQGQVDGETVGIVQLKGLLARQDLCGLRTGSGLKLLDGIIEEAGAGLEGLQEGLFLTNRNAQDALAVVGNLRVGRGHGIHDRIHEALHGGALSTQQLGGTDNATQQAAQDVPAALVARGHAIQDEHHAGTGVVSYHAEADIVLVGGLVTIGGAGKLLGYVNNWAQQVRFIDVVYVLQNAGHALDAQAGIDILLGQLADDLKVALANALAALILHEDQVPDLHVAVVIGNRAAVLAVLRTAVIINLGARATGSWDTHGPVVVLHAEALNALFWNSDLVAPNFGGLIIIEVDRNPQALWV